MTHEELILTVAKRLEWTEERTAGVVEAILEVIATELKMNNPVAIDDFGTLKTDFCPEYILANPETKERFLMPPSVEVILNSPFEVDKENPFFVADFTADEILYNELNSSFSQFEPTLLNEGVQFPGVTEIIAEEEEEEENEVLGPKPEEEKTVHLESDNQEKKENEVLENPTLQENEIFSSEFLNQTENVNEEPEYVQPQEEEILSLDISLQQEDSQSVEELREQPDIPDNRQLSSRSRSGRRLRSEKKITPVWIPIAGGIAIIVASLFFFKGAGKRKNGDGS